LLKGDPLNRVLHVDLTNKRYWVENREDLFERYLGGTGVAINLLEENCPKNADPLGPENPIVFAVGPLTGVFPTVSKTVAMFKSPLTGNLGESHAGGRSAIAIRMAGYGAIVIHGASNIPVYLAIHGDKVFFRDASALWGIGNTITVGRIIRENEPNPGYRTIMRIGAAGERLVRYACVTTETYRHFGRLGLGAVFGSKKLKAVVVSGKRSLPVKNAKEYRELYKEIYNMCVNSPLMKKYHDLGTAGNVLPLNKIGGLPTMNLKSGRFEHADRLSGEYLAENFLGRRIACAHCPVGCIHLAALREPYEREPYFYKTIMISYDYEPIYALGTMLGVARAEGLLRLLDKIEADGADAMSTGVVLAWATEAFEHGIISEKDTLGLKLKWGDYETYIKAIDMIVSQPNEFYRALARGVKYAANIYGSEEYALHYGGNEMPGYHTGPAAHVGFMTGARHSHLDSAGYSLDQKLLAAGEKLTPERIAESLFEEESWRQVLTSLVICLFARKVYAPNVVSRALEVVGYNLREEDLYEIGREILRRKYRFKVREGFSKADIKFPRRILETPSPHGNLDLETLNKAVDLYIDKLGIKIS